MVSCTTFCLQLATCLVWSGGKAPVPMMIPPAQGGIAANSSLVEHSHATGGFRAFSW